MSVDPDLAETGQAYAFTGDDPLNSTDPLGLASRKPPKRLNAAEKQAIKEKNAGDPYDHKEFDSATKKAQYNQKNGWSDDGESRTPKGTPLRNNQKRGRNSSAQNNENSKGGKGDSPNGSPSEPDPPSGSPSEPDPPPGSGGGEGEEQKVVALKPEVECPSSCH